MARPALCFALVSVLFACGGCGLLDSDPFRDHQRRLDQAMARWEASGPDAYRMVYQRGCFCSFESVQPVELLVRDGQVEERRFVDGDSVVAPHLAGIFLPVHRIFEVVQDAINLRPDQLDVEYDPVLGFPVTVYIDFRRAVADDEISHRILELVAEEADPSS